MSEARKTPQSHFTGPVVIDPLTRIEGHLRIEVEVKDGRVSEARSVGTLYRGLETILVGRDPRDVQHFTQRTCGVCTYTHALASTRALETATGCDLIIDDTPEAITLSSFDQTRREVARMALERLIADGRIHPARIEETVDKCRRELEIQMKREGDKAVMELGIHSLHPDLVKLIGRLKYRTSFGQNVLSHSLEVAWLAGLMAGELGVNVQLARRAGLLHDIGKALDHEIEGSHVQIGVDICKKYRENPQVIHAIEAHHGDVEPKTTLAFIIMAADAISAARPGARRENMESYIKRLETLEALCNGFEGVESSYAVQAGREVRILVQPDKVSDDEVILLARNVAKKIENELDYPGQIKVSVIRESRATEYAK